MKPECARKPIAANMLRVVWKTVLYTLPTPVVALGRSTEAACLTIDALGRTTASHTVIR